MESLTENGLNQLFYSLNTYFHFSFKITRYIVEYCLFSCHDQFVQ